MKKNVPTIYRSILGVALFVAMFTLTPFIDGKISADIFSITGTDTPAQAQDLLSISTSYRASKGSTGEIEVQSTTAQSGILGFAIDINFPNTNITAEDIVIEGTALEGKGFFVQKNTALAGKISIVGATGGDGVDLGVGQTLLKISFHISDTAVEGQEIPLQFEKISLIGSDLTEMKSDGRDGKIIVSFVSQGGNQLQDIVGTSNAIGMKFSGTVGSFSVADMVLLPSGITSNTTATVINDTVSLKNLTLNPQTQYTLLLPQNLQIGGSNIQESKRKIIFYPIDENNLTFGISSLETAAPRVLTAYFSHPPSDETLLPQNFFLRQGEQNFPITAVTRDTTDRKKIIFSIPDLPNDEYYAFSAHPLLVKNEEGASLGGKNLFIFESQASVLPKILRVEPSRIPFGYTGNLTLYGRNLSLPATVRTEQTVLQIISIAADKESLVVKVPTGIPKGLHDISFLQDDGQSSVLSQSLVIEEEQQQLQIISSQSNSSPKKVPNDGATTAKLFVLVDEPHGLDTIEKVTVDLRQFDGDAAVELTKGEIVDGKQFFILAEFTVPDTVATKVDPYLLPVTAQNKRGEYSTGTVSVIVSKDITASIKPQIKKSYAEPAQVSSNDEANPVRFFVEVYDEDGGDDIQTVAVELGKIGGETLLLDSKNEGNEHSKTRFYESTDGFVLPARIKNGTYSLPVRAIDTNGEEISSTIAITVGGDSALAPKIETDDFYISPQKTLVRDGKYQFYIHAKVSDPSGADNIESVTANLSQIGFGPLELTKGVKQGKSQWYSSPVMILPKNVSFGKHEITITATDIEGNSDSAPLEVDVVEKTSTGVAPTVVTAKGYTTPASSIPDGKTPFAAYVFVEDKDHDISHVVLHLKNYARYAGENLPSGTASPDKYGIEQCISTRTILCMQPILQEGNGRWYYINNLIVPAGVTGGNEAYHLPIVAVDTEGHVSESYFELFVADTENSLLSREKPYFKDVNVLDEQTIQLLLSSNLSPDRIKKEYFTISSSVDTTDTLDVNNVFVSPDGKVVALQTDTQIDGKPYALLIDAEKMGLRSEKRSDKVLAFTGYQYVSNTKTLKSIGIEATSPQTFVVSFNQDLDFISGTDKNNFEVFDVQTLSKIPVLSVEMLDNRSIEIRTDEQTIGAEYDIYYKNIRSVTGEQITHKQSKSTTAFAIPLSESLASLHHRADFNDDDIIDFKDFTMFAAVYGKTAAEAGDFNGDNTVDFSDFTLFSSQYNQSAPANDGTQNSTDTLLQPVGANGSAGSGSQVFSNQALTFDNYGDATLGSSTGDALGIGIVKDALDSSANYGFHGAPVPQADQPPVADIPVITPTPTAIVIPTASPSPTATPTGSIHHDPLGILLGAGG